MVWAGLLGFVVATSSVAGGSEDSLGDLAAQAGLVFGANLPYLVDGRAPNNWESSPIIELEKKLVTRHCRIVSAGWQTYPGHAWTGAGVYALGGIQRWVEWARANRLGVHFHGLAYSSRVGWLTKMPSSTAEELAAIREAHDGYVQTTVSQFKGKVALWDVCNEQLMPAYIHQGVQTSAPYMKAYRAISGETAKPEWEWYRRVFRAAESLDPKSEKLLLDFNNEVECPKSDTMFDLVKRLRAEGVPIDSVGFQMHLDTDLSRSKGHGYTTDETYFQSLAKNFDRFSKLGVRLWITELDVKMLPGSTEGRQAEVYSKVFETALRCPAFAGIKVWGVVDATPWAPKIEGDPNLFRADGSPKPAVGAIAGVLRSFKGRLGRPL